MILKDETSEEYHANAAIGSGDIRRMMVSPRLFKDGLDGYCDRSTPALLFGIASHMCLLEPDRFARRCVVKPEDMSFATTIGKDWKRDNAAGKHIVPYKDWLHLQRMHARMPSKVRDIMDRCIKETTVRTVLNGLSVQCRPDMWDVAGQAKYDLKTIDNIDSIDSAIWTHRYDVQDRWYSRVIGQETGLSCKHSALIFAEKLPPYRWRIVELDSEYCYAANHAIDEALKRIVDCKESGRWDDEEDIYEIASPPTWAEAPTINGE